MYYIELDCLSMKKNCFFLFCLLLGTVQGYSQTITQFEVFAGRFDYLAIGNTLNTVENFPNGPCVLLPESTATLALEGDQTVIAAYLYWAGSGTGDFEVTLNDTPIVAERTFADAIDDDRPFFAAFANITEQIQNSGSIDYTFSDLDIEEEVLLAYCPTGTNFAGWSIIVVFEDLDLPLNQVNIFDGLENVSMFNTSLEFTLTNLNVLDNEGARIGFLAWEGDANLAIEETLSINGNLLGNPPLNPINNQFNGTNSFTGSTELFNMDIDVYDIENNIAIGDDTAVIALTSGQDFVMINTVITVLNSQLPDAIISIDSIQTTCNSRDITVAYTVTNQGTEALPAGTQVSFFGDGILTGNDVLSSPIAMGASVENTTTIAIDMSVPEVFTLEAIVDDPAMVIESNENNNVSNLVDVNLDALSLDEITSLRSCDDVSNDGIEVFDLTTASQMAIAGQTGLSVAFYTSLSDATNQVNPIANPEAFSSTSVQQTIYIRFFLTSNPTCFSIVPLELEVSFLPIITELDPLQVCDDSLDNDMFAAFDLTTQDAAIINNQSPVVLSYHRSLEDAEEGINPIALPSNFINTQNPQVIYTRLENEQNPACYTVGFFDLIVNPIGDLIELDPLLACNEGFEIGTFDLTLVSELNAIPLDMISGFYTSLTDAEQEINAISDPFAFQNSTNPQTLFIRIEGDDILDCFQIAQINLAIENCPPFVPEGFSPNADGINDIFEISGLKNVFENYELLIYSRLGNLIYQGDNDVDFWDGVPNRGIGGSLAPTGVYYWVLTLNDPQFTDRVGWVYLNR